MNYKNLSIILLLGCCVISAYGQESEFVESVKNTLDESAQIHQREETNGRNDLDLKHRTFILDYIERLRTAYNQKDIKFIEQVFNDNTLFIQGKVKTIPNEERVIENKIEYVKQTSKQYLNNLRKIFARNNNIVINFEEIEINQHREKAKIYGVLMMQKWSSDNYHDEGYLFQLWDFTDENVPQIHIHSWQPAMINGKPLPKDEVLSLNDFDI